MTGSTVLGQLLRAFTRTLSFGVANSLPDVLWFFTIFATLELIVCGAMWAYGYGNVLSDVVWKVLGLSVLFWIMSEWQPLLKGVREGFIQAGLLSVGNVISMTDFTDPGNIIDFGMSTTAVVFKQVFALNVLTNFWTVVGGGAVAWIVIGAYCVIAAQIFMAILEFYLVGVCSIFLLPFLAFQKTAFIGERVFGSVIAHGIRLTVLTVILGIALPVLYASAPTQDPQLLDLVLLLGTAIVLSTLTWNAPAIANGIVSGIPVLHAGHALSSTAGVVSTAATIGATAAGVSILAGAGLRAAVTGTSALRSAAQRGAHNYQGAHGGGFGSSIVGGAQGVSQYVRGRATQGFRDAVNNGRIRATKHVP